MALRIFFSLTTFSLNQNSLKHNLIVYLSMKLLKNSSLKAFYLSYNNLEYFSLWCLILSIKNLFYFNFTSLLL